MKIQIIHVYFVILTKVGVLMKMMLMQVMIYPVSELHCLVIPKRHIKDYFDLTNEEF